MNNMIIFLQFTMLKRQNILKDKQIKEKQTQIFLPIENSIIIWYLIVMVSTIFDIFISIYLIMFEKQEAVGHLILLQVSVISLILALDIVISLNTGFFYKGTMITQKKFARIRYMKCSYFIFDLISLMGMISQYFLYQKFPFVKLIILAKMFKIGKYNEIISKYVIKQPNLKLFYELFKHFILLLMTCHIIGCMFFKLDLILIRLGWYPKDMLWVYNAYAYNNIIDLEYSYQYFYCFYFAVATLSGVAYGDITPLNPIQTAFTMFTLVIPLIIYSYVLSVLLNAIVNRRNQVLSLQKFRKVTTQYLKDSGIQQKQIPKFTNFLSFAYTNKINSADNNFLEIMDLNIKKQYIKGIFSHNFNYQIFQPLANPGIKFEIIKQLVESIGEQVSLFAHKKFCKSGKIKLHYILNGEVSEYIYLRDKKFTKLHRVGSYYFQYAFYTGLLNSHENFIYQTNKFTICLAVDKDRFQQVLRKNQSALQSYHKLRKQIIFSSQLQAIKVNCFFCQSSKHTIDNCPRLNLIPNKHTVIEQTYNLTKNKRQPSKRRPHKDRKQQSKLKTIKQQQLPYLQKETQTQYWNQQHTQLIFDYVEVDRARNWRNYDSMFNI